MDGMAELTDLGSALTQWQLVDAPICAVRLADVHGFGATPPAQLLLTDGQSTHGTLLGGAADAQALELARQVLTAGAPRTADTRLAEPEALDAGLACAGSATMLAHRLPEEQAELLAEAFLKGVPAALVSGPSGTLVAAGHGAERVVSELDEESTRHVVAEVRELLRRGATCTATIELSGAQAAVDVWVPTTGLLIVGAGVLGAALTAQAALLGWAVRTTTAVAETEQAVATLTSADAVVILDHDPAFDGALLRCARGPAFAGALGSRHTQSARRERLLAAGATEAELERMHGPVGLDLGARDPAETAVSVVAEVIAWRNGRVPTALTATTGRIGV